MENNNSKKYKKIIILLLFIIIIFLALSFSIYALVKKNMNNAIISEIFDGIKNSEISFFTDNKFYNSLLNKLEEDDYKVKSEIGLSTTMENNIVSSLDLSNFKIKYIISRNQKNDISYHSLLAKYGENDFLKIDFVNEEKIFGIKSDEIVNRFVGMRKSNFQEVADKVMEKDIDLKNARKMKNFLIDRKRIDLEKISNYSEIENYIDILKSNVHADYVLKKENVVVTLEKDQISTTEYTINFTAEQYNSILRNLSNDIENNDKILDEFVIANNSTNAKNSNKTTKNNNSTVEIKAKENNYQATINIWNNNEEESQNQTQEQTTDLQRESQFENNTASDNSISNNTAFNNTSTLNQIENQNIENNENTIQFESTNNVNNEIVNTTLQQNINQDLVTNNIVQNDVNNAQEITINQETTQQQEQNVQEEQTINMDENENTITEDDNFRIQGFISVNENDDYIGEDEFIIGENFEETLNNITRISRNINWISYIITGAKANCTKEEMKEFLLSKINEEIKNSNTLIAKVYINNNKAVKLNLEIPETKKSVDFEIVSKGSKEKYFNVKKLTGEEDEVKGRIISIYKKEDDNDNKIKININKIENNRINNKISIDIKTNGTANSQKYTNSIDLFWADGNGEFKINTLNKIDFSKDVSIEELNEDNCLFIDEISDEELILTRDEIKEKILLVLKEKNQDLQIIDTANSNNIIMLNDE